MTGTPKSDSQEMRYLLGTLSEDEQTRMEDAFFADDSTFDRLEILEDELIDAYVHEDLSPEQRHQFEARLKMSPRLVERVHFARALAQRLLESAQPHGAPSPSTVSVSRPATDSRRSWWATLFPQQPAFRMTLAACLVLLLVGAALLTGWLRVRREAARIDSERAQLQRKVEDLERDLSVQQAKSEQRIAELQRARDQLAELQRAANQSQDLTGATHGASTIASLFLTPGALRSDGAGAQLLIGPETNTAHLQLLLEKSDYHSYNVTIKRGDGSTVFAKKSLSAHVTRSGSQLLLSLPSRSLQANHDYLIHVDAVTGSGQVEDFADYQFRVAKKPH